jgi:quercetin dioxygenase-like cupin family protein
MTTQIFKSLGLLMLLAAGSFSYNTWAHEGDASNIKPLSFGHDQTIIDLNKITWSPLEVEGLASGAEIAVLRGDLGKDHSESVLKLPPGYVVRSHTHTSDELYVWISGSFTLIAHDGEEKRFDGPAYINFPGNAPPHGLKCGNKEPCLLYLRYSRPFDIKY